MSNNGGDIRWNFRCYLTASKVDDIDAWYRAQDAEVRADFDAILELLEARPNHEWRRPNFDKLQGRACRGLGEIRIIVSSGHYRVLGYFGPTGTRHSFTMLIGFKKTSKKSEYNHQCKIAQVRKSEVEDDPTRARTCQFP